ncbi:MAG: hypothetical protein IJB23_05495 [Alistipes sp.]|nr:hypothetical protein [Alistipes sp.]
MKKLFLISLALFGFAVACKNADTDFVDKTEKPIAVQNSYTKTIEPTKEEMEKFVADLLTGVLGISNFKDVALYEDGICIKEIGQMSPYGFDGGGRYIFNDMIFFEDGTCRMIYSRQSGCQCEDPQKDTFLYTKVNWSCNLDTFTFTLTSERLAKDEKNTNATTSFKLLSYDAEKRLCQLQGLMPTNITNKWEFVYVDIPIWDEEVRARLEVSYIDEDLSPCGAPQYDSWYFLVDETGYPRIPVKH